MDSAATAAASKGGSIAILSIESISVTTYTFQHLIICIWIITRSNPRLVLLSRTRHLTSPPLCAGPAERCLDRYNFDAMTVTAFVTGASGYVGAEIVRQLLEKGYRVKAAVRCAESPKLRCLQQLADTLPGELQLCNVPDLQRPSAALDAAIAGSRYAFHVASPFRFDGDPLVDIINPALEGTRTVLEAAARQKPGLQRIVVTSSVCAIHDQHAKQQPQGPKYTEMDWNRVSTPLEEPYWSSKVQAEELAWQLAAELDLSLITILPNFVLGPVLSEAADGVSVGFMKAFLEAPGGSVPNGNWTVNDVRDVARAHILAAESPSASGRYIVSLPHSISARTVTAAIKRCWQAAAEALPDGEEAEVKNMCDVAKVQRELGLELTDVEVTLADMAESLLRLGIAKPAWYCRTTA